MLRTQFRRLKTMLTRGAKTFHFCLISKQKYWRHFIFHAIFCLFSFCRFHRFYSQNIQWSPKTFSWTVKATLILAGSGVYFTVRINTHIGSEAQKTWQSARWYLQCLGEEIRLDTLLFFCSATMTGISCTDVHMRYNAHS